MTTPVIELDLLDSILDASVPCEVVSVCSNPAWARMFVKCNCEFPDFDVFICKRCYASGIRQGFRHRQCFQFITDWKII